MNDRVANVESHPVDEASGGASRSIRAFIREGVAAARTEAFKVALALAPFIASLSAYTGVALALQPYGVTPAEIGVGPTDLVVPAVAYMAVTLVGSTLALCAYGSVMFLAQLARAHDYGNAAGTLGLLVAVFGLNVWVLRDLSLARSLVRWGLIPFELSLAFCVLLALNDRLIFRRQRRRWSFSQRLAVLLLALLALSPVLAPVAARRAPPRLNSMAFFPFHAGPTFRFVKPLTQEVWSAGATCIVHLGRHDGRDTFLVSRQATERAEVVLVEGTPALAPTDSCPITLPGGGSMRFG